MHTEVQGKMLLALIENINYASISATVEQFGLAQINPDQWYPLQTLIDTHNTLAHQPNAQSNMVAIGVKAAETAVLPPHIDSFKKLLEGYDYAYRVNYRNLPADNRYDVQFTGEDEAIVTNYTHNPNEIVYGVLWGFAKRFTSPGKTFVVQGIDQAGAPVLELADQAQRFLIQWER